MIEYDFFFLCVNTFINKVQKFFKTSAKKKSKPLEKYDLNDGDYIDVNINYNQKNTLEKFYKIYNQEKVLYEQFSSQNGFDRVLPNDKKTKIKYLAKKESEILNRTCFQFFKRIFLYIFLVRIVNVASDFFGPLLLGKLLGITTQTSINLQAWEKNICYFYIFLFIASNLTRIFSSMIFNYNLNLIRNQIEIIVNDLIFKKVLVVSKKAKNYQAKITKFLNDDISTFFGFFINLNRSWELPIEIILAIYGTYKHVSMAFLPGLLFAIVLLYANYRIAVNITDTNKELYKVRLDRQEHELLALKNLKSIKFEFLEKFFIEKIYDYRKIEFSLLTYKKYLDALCCYLWAASPVLISFFSIFSYLLSGKLIDAEKVFTTISLLNMTIHPMNVFPWIFAEFKDAKRVYEKFVKFLIKGKQHEVGLTKGCLTKDCQENMSSSYPENVLLELSDVKIRYNKLRNKENKDLQINQTNNSEETNKLNESFEICIEKKNKLLLEKGQIVVIYGGNASGKSLLLKSILDNSLHKEKIINIRDSETETLLLLKNDEAKGDEQFFIKNSNISFVSQELWTFSGSIYENITFDTEYPLNITKINDYQLNSLGKIDNEKKSHFNEILNKCEMLKDINSFPEKENKIIDFKGSNISGGQKQRINIARAAFNRKSEIILFDNCLSSIDANIANLIFTNLFHFLKNQGKGILFVTSDNNWIDKADKVYFIEKNNLVLKNDSSQIRNIINNNSTNLKINEIGSEGDNTLLHSEEIDIPLKGNNSEDIQGNNKSLAEENIENIENENLSISYKTLIFFFSKAGYSLFLVTILFLAFMQLGRNFIELFLADWLKNDKLTMDKKQELQLLNMKYYALFVILHTIVTIGRSWFFAIYFLKACDKIYKLTIEKFIFSKIKFMQKFNIGYFTNLMQNEILTVDERLPFEFNRLLDFSIKLIGSTLVIGYSTYSIYFIILFIVFAYYYTNLYNNYTIASKFLEEKKNQIKEPLTNLFLDSLEGKRIINCYQQQMFFNNRLNYLITKKIRINHTDQALWFWLGLRLDFLSFSIYSTVIILIAGCVYNDKYEFITFLSLALTTALNITSPLSSFLPWLGVTEDKFRAVERIRKTLNLLEDESEDVNKISDHISKKGNSETKIITNNLAVQFKNVFLKFQSEGDFILNNLSFNVNRGEKIAIIGRTGAGKSTIFSALTKQEDICNGDIFLFSKNISNYDLNGIRSKIAFISKEVFLMEGSIRENLDFLKNYRAAEIEEFLLQFERLFAMKEFEIFNKHNFELNLIEKNGSNLSEGQKNLLNILRALLKRKPVICFDESNSELDNETEKLLFDIIFEKYKDITFIIITHKLQILNKFDCVYLIDEGKIIKQGAPKEFITDYTFKSYELK